MIGFDGKSKVLVRGKGFISINEVYMGQQVATLDNGEWSWEIPIDFKSFEINEVMEVGGPRFDLVCSPDNKVVTDRSNWEGDYTDTLRFGRRGYNVDTFVDLVTEFLLGGQITESGLTIIEPDDRLMVAVEDLGLKYEIVGSYIDIDLPDQLKWFFLLFGSEIELRIPELIKNLPSKLLKRIWKSFVGESIRCSSRLKADISELVLKSQVFPKWNRREELCIVDNDEYTAGMKDKMKFLTSVKTESGYILIERNGKVSWNQSREII